MSFKRSFSSVASSINSLVLSDSLSTNCLANLFNCLATSMNVLSFKTGLIFCILSSLFFLIVFKLCKKINNL